jgi:hypothetical protein
MAAGPPPQTRPPWTRNCHDGRAHWHSQPGLAGHWRPQGPPQAQAPVCCQGSAGPREAGRAGVGPKRAPQWHCHPSWTRPPRRGPGYRPAHPPPRTPVRGDAPPEPHWPACSAPCRPRQTRTQRRIRGRWGLPHTPRRHGAGGASGRVPLQMQGMGQGQWRRQRRWRWRWRWQGWGCLPPHPATHRRPRGCAPPHHRRRCWCRPCLPPGRVWSRPPSTPAARKGGRDSAGKRAHPKGGEQRGGHHSPQSPRQGRVPAGTGAQGTDTHAPPARTLRCTPKHHTSQTTTHGTHGTHGTHTAHNHLTCKSMTPSTAGGSSQVVAPVFRWKK